MEPEALVCVYREGRQAREVQAQGLSDKDQVVTTGYDLRERICY